MLSSVCPKTERPQFEEEKDRYPLQAGIRFVITDFEIIQSKQYGRFVKINGYDLITRQLLKYRTTAKQVITQLETIKANVGTTENGKLKQEIKVLVGQYKAKNGTGLELQDPA